VLALDFMPRDIPQKKIEKKDCAMRKPDYGDQRSGGNNSPLQQSLRRAVTLFGGRVF
jgi:hypothetical protein